MLGFLYRLFIGTFKSCDHVWEINEKYETQRISSGAIKGTEYILKCKHCGNMKRESFQIH